MSHGVILRLNRFAGRLVPRIDFDKLESIEKEKANGGVTHGMQISVDETEEKEKDEKN